MPDLIKRPSIFDAPPEGYDPFNRPIEQAIQNSNTFGSSVTNELPSELNAITANPTRIDAPVVMVQPSTPVPPIGPQPNAQPAISPYDAEARMRALFTPEHAAQDRLNRLLNDMPTEDSTMPQSRTRAILNGLITGYDPRLAESIHYRPYNMATEAWKRQIEPVKDLASIEHQGNVQSRLSANSIISNEMAARRLEETAARNNDLAAEAQRKLDLAERAAKDKDRQFGETLKEKQRQFDAQQQLRDDLADGGELKEDAQGNGWIVTKKGELKPIPEWKGMSLEDRAKIKARYAAQVKKTTTGNQDKPQIRVVDDPENPGTKIVVSVMPGQATATPVSINSKAQSNEMKPTATSQPSPVTTENAKRIALNNRARELKSSDPNGKYITIDKKGNFVEIEKPWLLGGPSQEVYDDLKNKLLGTTAPTSLAKSTTQAAPAPGKAQAGVKPGYTRMKKPNGDIVQVPNENVNKAKTEGKYTVVQ